ncbi:MAG: RNA polymerase sigma factor [Candidatus Baltobacteraceae bacterium]
MRVQDDERLMARVRTRDSAAFEAIYDTHHRLVYGIAFRMLGQAGTAEDVTQNVFLKIWSEPERFTPGNFPGWLARMTRNRCLDVLRSKSRQPGELPEQMPDEHSMEERAFASIDAANVRAALAQLPPEQREPIEMGFFGGITHEEIARRTGTALGTIKTRIRTGLRRLRTALDETVAV